MLHPETSVWLLNCWKFEFFSLRKILFFWGFNSLITCFLRMSASWHYLSPTVVYAAHNKSGQYLCYDLLPILREKVYGSILLIRILLGKKEQTIVTIKCSADLFQKAKQFLITQLMTFCSFQILSTICQEKSWIIKHLSNFLNNNSIWFMLFSFLCSIVMNCHTFSG